MKKKIVILVTTILLIIMIVIISLNIAKKEPNSDTEIKTESYVCSKEQQKTDFATIDYYYKFDLKNNNIENARQEIVFTYFEKGNYQNSDIENSFTKSVPDRTEKNDDDLTRSFIWNILIPSTGDFSIDNYLKIVETYGYSNCELKK